LQKEKVIVIGGGPCGMACAIDLKNMGIDPLIIEKENVVHTIHQFPTHQMFFSSSDRLEIGEVPFITENKKPVRNQALAYYREVAARKELRMHTFERVTEVKRNGTSFKLYTEEKLSKKQKIYEADYVIFATGYYDQPNYMNIPGENLNKVAHYFEEAHPFYNKDVAVIGGKNSAVDATLELHKAGANVTVLYRGDSYSKSIKPWILPEFDSLIRNGYVTMHFNAMVDKIEEEELFFNVNGAQQKIKNDFVFAMTGYRPDLPFLSSAGIEIHPESGKPFFDETTYETNIPNIYVAGVIAAGYNNNEIFIENGRFHGKAIASSIAQKDDII